jgi:hypothetical protein
MDVVSKKGGNYDGHIEKVLDRLASRWDPALHCVIGSSRGPKKLRGECGVLWMYMQTHLGSLDSGEIFPSMISNKRRLGKGRARS